jgi:peptide/nickel transport system substrate-binding protein
VRRLLLALAALAAVSCGDGPGRRSGGTLVVAIPGDADVLLPPVLARQLSAQVTEHIFPKLAQLTVALDLASDSGYVPVLAERWERRDSLTIVFHLDPRAHWQDGQPISSADVVFTFDVWRDTLTASPYAELLEPIEAVTAEGPRRAVFRFRRFYADQLYDATHHLRMIPRHLLDSIPRDRLASSRFAREPVGAGPFRFERWSPGSEIVLVADSTWFRGPPQLDRIVWRVMPDGAAATAALHSGEADAIEFIPQREELDRIRASATVRLVPYASPFLMGIAFNVRNAPFDDPALRRALAHATDRATMVASVFGEYGTVPVGSTARVQWIAEGTIAQVPHDLAAAARLLDSLGWRDTNRDGIRDRGGRPLRIRLAVPTTSRVRQQAALLLRDQWRRAGIDVVIQPLEFGVFEQRTRAGEFEAMMFSWTMDPSPTIIAQFWGRGAPENRGGYASARFDSLLGAAAASRSRAEALPRWHALLEHLNFDAPALFLMSPVNHAAVSNRFENVTIRPDSWLATVATWRLAPQRAAP